jgi:Pectate lyase
MRHTLVRPALFLLAGLAFECAIVGAQTIPAFPGADGAAANVTGGRGGSVYHVTKLDKNFSDNAPGTLRYGLTDSNFPAGARTIVFDVAGTFWLGRYGAEKNHNNGWDTQSRINLGNNITIAGQTAPGPVYIMGGTVKAGSTNVILRNVTIAPGYGMRSFEQPDASPPVLPTAGDFPDSYVYDAIDISGTNTMIDHVSTMYATDETISANELANNITIQYSNISQGQNYPQADAESSGTSYTGHALGSLLQAGSNAKISVHHNLYANQKGRLPRVGSEVGTGPYNDFRDNVFYNWLGTAGSGASGQPSFDNFVSNYFRAGPGGDNPVGGASTAITTSTGGTSIFSGSNSTGTRVYHTGNVKDTNKNSTAEFTTSLTNSDFGSSSFQASPQWYQGQATYTGVTDTAAAAYDRVLKYMGAMWWTRDFDYTQNNTAAIDTPDERLIHETATGTGKIMAWADDPFNNDPNEGTEWRQMLSFRADTTTGAAPYNRAANWDTDGDGMPDAWEKNHNLNPNLADNNGDFDSDGYTNLEEYINEIAAWPAPQPIGFNGATNNRYAQITNWDIRWQPSKYDQVQINNGAAVVDAVGQHAGTLIIAAQSGNTAQLNITDGWLLVNDAVVIGGTPTASGTLNLSGGTLTTPLLSKGNAGQFNFTGGTLHADVVTFDLVNNGGTISPGQSLGHTAILGQLQINSGVLEIDLESPTSFDTVTATLSALLGGDLHVRLANGFLPGKDDTFEIVTGQTVSGSFANLSASNRVHIDGSSASLLVTTTNSHVTLSNFLTGVPGDYNNDGIVDTSDYVVWRKSLANNTPLNNETATFGVVDQADLDAWRANYGTSMGQANLALSLVPEPTTNLFALVGASVWLLSGMAGRTKNRALISIKII